MDRDSTASGPQGPLETAAGRSIVTRVRMAIAGVSAVVVIIAFAVLWAGWSAYQVDRRTNELSSQLGALSAAEQASSAEVPDELRDQLLRIEAGLLGAALFVTDDSGVVLRTSEDGATLRSIDLARLEEVEPQGMRQAVITASDGSRLLVVAVAAGQGRWLVAVQKLAELRHARTGVTVAAGLGLLVAVSIAWIAGGWLAGRLTRPLRELQSGARRIAEGHYGSHIEVAGDVEVASLAQSFNEMSDRVAHAYEAQRAFVGDVSHEIKTPLTSISGFARALVDGTAATPEQREQAARTIFAEATRMEELTQTLLSLAQLDAGAIEVVTEPIDLGMLADALAGRFAAKVAEPGAPLLVSFESGHGPLGDPDRLLQCATALVANAYAHAGSGARVEVRDEIHGERWWLVVDDDGPGVPPDSRERIFGRFTRLDGSRSSTSGGTGLGLAICSRLAVMMSGRVWVTDSPSGGARFIIELPAA